MVVGSGAADGPPFDDGGGGDGLFPPGGTVGGTTGGGGGVGLFVGGTVGGVGGTPVGGGGGMTVGGPGGGGGGCVYPGRAVATTMSTASSREASVFMTCLHTGAVWRRAARLRRHTGRTARAYHFRVPRSKSACRCLNREPTDHGDGRSAELSPPRAGDTAGWEAGIALGAAMVAVLVGKVKAAHR